MADAKDQRQELRAWYKSVLDTTVRELLRTEAISGTAIEAAPMWAVPNEILIAKVWDATQKSQFIWAIAGDKAITDHVPGSIAANPQEVARHFALKWQMDADRLTAVAQERANTEHGGEVVEDYTAQLIKKAEALYDLAARDDIWKGQASL